MKKNALLLVGILCFGGCESKTGTGALVGAGAGALAGGLIGGNAAGVLIGGAVGAGAGAAIGASLDAADRNKLEENNPDTLRKIDDRKTLDVSDIEALSRNGIEDDVIIDQIKSTKSVFHLSSDQILDLKNQGVSQKVIDYMIRTGES